MTQAINIAEALMPEAERIIQLMYNSDHPAVRWPNNPPYIRPNEVLTSIWPQEDMVAYARSQQSFIDHGIARDLDNYKMGTYPRLELRNIHIPQWDGIDWGQAEDISPPTRETRTSQSVELFKGDISTLTISDTFSSTTSLLDAARTAVEEAVKVRLGSLSTPVGAELGTTITEEYTKTFGHTEEDSQSINSTVNVTNTDKEPVRIHLEATRKVASEHRHCAIKADFDYSIYFYPFYTTHIDPFVWGSKEQFINCFMGEEPDNVASQSDPRWPSFGEWCRERPQPNAGFDKLNMPVHWEVEYSRALETEVEQVREKI